MLPALLAITLPLLALAGYAVMSLSSKLSLTRRVLDEERALQAAEAGLEEAVYRANTASLAGGTSFTLSLGRGLACAVTVVDTATDGEDNDQDGTPDEPDEDGFAVTSQGTYRGSKRRVTAFVRRIAILPAIPAAIALQDPAAVLNINGNAFEVDGTDMRLNGSPGTEPPIYGVTIANPGTTAALLGTLTTGQRDNIDGSGGSPSAAVATPIDVDALTARLAAFAHVILTPGNYGSIAGFGSVASNEWRITRCTGSLTISGNLDGAGILVVDGDLEMKGNTSFTGLVLVRGVVRFTGGGTAKSVRGSLIVGSDAGVGTPLEASGSVELHYSSEALRRVEQLAARYALVGWRELARE